jgi:hypothetical protein
MEVDPRLPLVVMTSELVFAYQVNSEVLLREIIKKTDHTPTFGNFRWTLKSTFFAEKKGATGPAVIGASKARRCNLAHLAQGLQLSVIEGRARRRTQV